MKLQITTLAVPAVLACSLLMPSLSASAQSVPARLANQQRRINQGIRGGELTRRETGTLERRDNSIRRAEFRDRMEDRRTGGVLTARQDARLDHRLNNTSRAIYRLKHNARVAG